MRRGAWMLAGLALLGCGDSSQTLARVTVTVLEPQSALPVQQEPDGVVIPVGIAAVVKFQLLDDKGAPFEAPWQVRYSEGPNFEMVPVKDQSSTYLLWGREPGVTAMQFEPTEEARKSNHSGTAILGVYVAEQPYVPAGNVAVGGASGAGGEAGSSGQAGEGQGGAGQGGT